MIFVSKSDPDYQLFLTNLLEKRQQLKGESKPTDLQIFSRQCEKAIQQMVSSSENIILKELLFSNEKEQRYSFQEFDYHLPDKKIVGEIKCSFDFNRALQSAKKQHKKNIPRLAELGYNLQYIIIDAKNTKVTDIVIDDRAIIRVSGGAVREYLWFKVSGVDSNWFY
jgi:hypothetical protein